MSNIKKYKFAIAGAGFSGAVLARELVTSLPCEVIIFEERDHTGGNCHTSRDIDTGVMVYRYGPHIFNTNININEVWDYVHEFCNMGTYIYQVKANTSKDIFSLPINLNTTNEIYNKRFTPREAMEFISNEIDSTIIEPKNFEEVAIASVGRPIYEILIRDYSTKQLGCHPKEIPTEVVKRLPIRYNYNNNYHKSKYVRMPENGYSGLIDNILNHPNISIKLNSIATRSLIEEYDHLYYCGPIDKFYNYKFGELGYRTVFWKNFVVDGDFQGISQMNYTESNPEFTRIIEHKHFNPWENHKKSYCSTEYSKETTKLDIPYFPKKLEEDLIKFNSYMKYAIENESEISFLGRLATYRYLDMDKTIFEEIQFAKDYLVSISSCQPPVFPKQDL